MIPTGMVGPPDGVTTMDLTSQALSSAPPQQQKQMLGEALYPKINAQQPELAGKITGMLLEMDNTELLNLIEDDAALRAKVDEALTVYDEYVKNKGGEGEPSTSASAGDVTTSKADEKPKKEAAEPSEEKA